MLGGLPGATGGWRLRCLLFVVVWLDRIRCAAGFLLLATNGELAAALRSRRVFSARPYPSPSLPLSPGHYHPCHVRLVF